MKKDHLKHAVPHATFDAGSLFRAFLWVGVTVGALYILEQIRDTLLVFGLAWMIAYMLNPLVNRMQHRRLGPIRSCPRALAIMVVFLVALSLALLVGSLLFPVVIGQVNHLIQLGQNVFDPDKLSTLIGDKVDRLSNYVPVAYRAEVLEKVRGGIASFSTEAAHSVATVLARFGDFFVQILKGALLFFSASLISIFVLDEWDSLSEAAVGAFPDDFQDDARHLLTESNRILGGYLKATIITSLLCACSTLAVLELFGRISGTGAPYAAVVAVVTGVLYPIPLFGILTSTTVAAVLGFIPEMSLSAGLWCGGLCLVVNGVIDRTVQPKLMGDAIGVSPLFVIFAAAAGGELIGGIIGMLMGIPFAAMAKVLFSWFRLRFLVAPKRYLGSPRAPVPRRPRPPGRRILP